MSDKRLESASQMRKKDGKKMISKTALVDYLEKWRNKLGSTPPEEAAMVILKAVIDKIRVFPEEDAPDINTRDKWIPVSKKLPEDEEKVLVCTEYRYKNYDGTEKIVRRRTCAMYESGNLMCEDSMYVWDHECRGEYIEEKDDYKTSSGWFEITIMEHDEWTAVAIDEKVMAWMPLPEAYKEEQHE